MEELKALNLQARHPLSENLGGLQTLHDLLLLMSQIFPKMM